MTVTWTNKHGSWRVRHEPPTLAEAIAAAQGLADDIESQVEIAASLMNVKADDVRAEMQKSRRQTVLTTSRPLSGGVRAGVLRSVVVERMPSRRFARPAGR